MSETELKPNFEFIRGLANGPENQIDPKLCEILKELDDKPLGEVRSGLHKALDFGARYALASAFVMTALDVEWKRLGGKHDDPAPWRAAIDN